MPELLYFSRTLVLGAGALGTLLVERLRPHSARLRVYDIRPRDGVVRADAERPEGELLADLQDADLVILALPEEALRGALAAIYGLLPPSSLIVETGSVKTSLLATLEGAAPGAELMGLNPLFGPSLDFAGQSAAVIEHRKGPRGELFKQCLRHWQTTIVELTAEQHDRLTAITQAAVHCALITFGAVLTASGSSSDALLRTATPPCHALLLLLGRILLQNPEVYWDIQTANPFAAAARASMSESLAKLDRIVSRADRYPDFEAMLAEMAGALRGVLPGSFVTSDRMLLAIARGAA
jgi:4-amino-4-deoxyprephenate dehydrogenase